MTTMTSQQILIQAEKMCLQRGVRLTSQRAEVLRLMAEQPGSISAYDLLDQLRISEPQGLSCARLPAGAGFCASGGVQQQLCDVSPFRGAGSYVSHAGL